MASHINAESMIAIGAALPAVCILTVCARFYIRITHKQGLKADDWLVLLAMFMVIGMGIAIIIGVERHVLGFASGSYYTDASSVDWSITFLQQIEVAVFPMNILAIGFVKISLVFFYRRIFYTGTNRGFNIFTKILAGFLAIWMTACFLQSIFLCGTHFAVRWGSYADIQKYCVNAEAMNIIFVSTDVISDIVLFVMPIPQIWRLNMSLARRLVIVLAFAMGALAVVTSIVRAIVFALIYVGINSQTSSVGDNSGIIISLILYWTQFESGIAVIAVCLPTLQIWVRKINIEAVARNALRLLSFSRGSGGSVSRLENANDSRSSQSKVNSKTEPLELGKLSEQSLIHEVWLTQVMDKSGC